MLLLMSITVHIPFVTQNTKPDNLIRKTRNKMDFIGLLGLLQTVRGKQGQAPYWQQGQRDFDQKDFYGL